MNHNHQFKRLYITQDALSDPVTEKIIRKFPSRIQQVIPSDDAVPAAEYPDPKNVLLLTRSKGELVKACPGTGEEYLCCNYQVINQTQNCPMQCSYCILQFYLNQPATILYTNFDDIFTELKNKLAQQPARFFRIGTGELGDSLAVDGSVRFAKAAVDVFATIPNALLELKSKTPNIEKILDREHGGHTVLAWSLNPPEIIQANELKTARLNQRLAAARKAAEAGFLLAFHFDPILYFPDWEQLYSRVVDELYLHVPPERIAWISMGSLRFPPSMKEKIVQRYPHTTLPFEEMVRGMDGKLRYARPLRLPLYRLIYERLSSVSEPPFLYFCMESPLIWKEVIGRAPESNTHLDFMFAESLSRRFPGLITEEPKRADYDSGRPLG